MLTILGPKNRFCDGVSRRNFLKIGALGLGGLSLPQILQADSARGSKLSQVGDHDFPPGRPVAPGHVRPEDGRPSEMRGEFKPISTNVPGIQICEHLPGSRRS